MTHESNPEDVELDSLPNDDNKALHASSKLGSTSNQSLASRISSKRTKQRRQQSDAQGLWLIEAPDVDFYCPERQYMGDEVTDDLLHASDVWSTEQLLEITDRVLASR